MNNEEQVIKDGYEAVGKEESDEEKDVLAYDETDFKRSLTNTEKMLLNHEGVLSGSHFNEIHLYNELDKLSPDLSEKESYSELLYLLKEDYSHEVKTLVNFDDAVHVGLKRPDGSMEQTINPIRYVILLDASGSMYGQVNGISKMEIAKKSIGAFAEALPSASSISLSVYGHKGTNRQKDKELSCESTEEVYSGPFNKQTFNESVKKIQPSGWTPIALALQSIKNHADSNEKLIAYVVSDGIETCGGDPVHVVKELKKSGIDITVNIIGFDMDHNGQRLLKEVSDEGNGEFRNVQSQDELDTYLRQQYELQQFEWSNWKDSGVKQAIQVSDRKKLEVTDIENNIKEIASREYKNLANAQEYLEKTFIESTDHSDGITALITDRYYTITKYATDTSKSIRSHISTNASKEIKQYNEEGNEKVNENFHNKMNVNE